MNDKKLGWSSVVSAIVSYLLFFRRVYVGLSTRQSVTAHLQFALRQSCDLWVPSFVHWVIVCWWESLGGLAQDQSPTFWSYCHMKTTGGKQGCQMLVWTQDLSCCSVGSVAWHKNFGHVKLFKRLTYPLFLHLEKLVIHSRSPNLS